MLDNPSCMAQYIGTMILLTLLLSWQLQLTQNTRVWESKMGLPHHRVIFEAMEGYCGQLRTVGPEVVIVYSPARSCQRWFTAQDLAVHELCHAKMQHQNVDMPTQDQEREVKACMLAYRGRR